MVYEGRQNGFRTWYYFSTKGFEQVFSNVSIDFLKILKRTTYFIITITLKTDFFANAVKMV